MRVVPDARKVSDHLTRWWIDCSRERTAGLVASRYCRKDDADNPFETKKAAEAFAKILGARLTAGGTAGGREKTFGDAVEAWKIKLRVRQLKGVFGEQTLKDDLAQVENHILGKWTLRRVPIEKVRLSTITYSLLNQELFQNSQAFDTKLQRVGIIKLLQKFRAIFDVAVDEQWIATSPATKIVLEAPVEDRDDKAIDPSIFGRFKSDVPALLAALEIIDPDSVLPIEVLRKTGIRSGELLALSLDQVTTTNQKTKLKIKRAWKKDKFVGRTKSGLARYAIADVELGTALKTHALQTQRRGDDLLFGDGVQVLDRAGLRLRWHQAQFAIRGWGFFRSSNTRDSSRAYSLVELPKRIGKFTHEGWRAFAFGQAGLRKGELRERLSFPTIEAAAAHIRLTLFSLHDLRHLYASQLLHAGVPLHRVAQRLGDKESTVEGYYAHYLPEDDEADLEDIAAIAAIGG